MTDYYKAARANGWDFRTGNTINYRANIGENVVPPNARIPPSVCMSGILHARGTLESALRASQEIIAKGYGRSVYRITGNPVVSDGNDPKSATYGFVSLYIVEELTEYYIAP